MSSENDRESSVSRLKEGFSNSYVVEGAEMLLQKLTVVGISSNIPGDEIISVVCEKDEQLDQLDESGKALEVVKCWDVENIAGASQHKKVAVKCSPEIRSYIMKRNGG